MHLNNGTLPPLRILLLEDHAADADLVIAELRHSGMQANVKVVGTRVAYLENLDPALTQSSVISTCPNSTRKRR